MPTYWKYRTTDEIEIGPVTFQELVQSVRKNDIDRETKVFSVGQKKWMYASDVFGLFYMSMRKETRGLFDELQEDATQLGFTSDELCELLSQAEQAGDDLDEPSWQKRLKEVAVQRGAERSARRQQEHEERFARRVETGLTEATADAMARLEQTDVQREKHRRVREYLKNVCSAETAGRAFAYTCAFVAANLTAFGILNWSQTELQRYPVQNLPPQSYQVFPLWGICSNTEYLLLLLPSMIVAAMAAYGGAKLMIAMTDG